MDIIEFARKTLETAAQDEGLKNKLKDVETSILMVWKNGGVHALTCLINKGDIHVEDGECINPDFQFEVSVKDFLSMITNKTSGWILVATKRLVMTKGSWSEFNKIAKPLGAVPKIAMDILAEGKSHRHKAGESSIANM